MNFRRILSVFTAFFLIVSLFCGCKQNTNPTLDEKPNEIEETTVSLSETAQETDKEGFYQLGSEIANDNENIKIVAGNEIAHLVSKTENGLEVMHFSVFENKRLGNTKIEGTDWSYGILEKDGFFVVDLPTANLLIFDKKGTKTKEIKLEEGALNFAFVQKNGKSVIYKLAESNAVYKLKIETNEKTKASKSFKLSENPTYDERGVYIKDYTGRSYCIDFETFSVKKTKTEPFREYIGPLGIASERKFFTVTDLYNGEEKIMVEKRDQGEKIICADETRFITTHAENQGFFRLYDFSKGNVSDRISSSEEKVLDAQFIAGEYILVAFRNTETAKNSYKLLNINEDTKLQTTIINRLFERTVYSTALVGEQETETIDADQIADMYGVRLLHGKLGKDFKTKFTYSVAPAEAAKTKFSLAERVFNTFTKGLLMEATCNREIWVYLCTGLKNKKTDYSKYSAQTELYNHKLIFIDITCSDEEFIENLAHQLAHILDDYMTSSEKAGFSKLTPENIKKASYKNSYTAALNDKYTQKESEGWFCNKYCKISEKEDRVITLGEMFSAIIISTPTEKFVSNNVKKKAEFMAKALEKTFDCCKQSKGEPWEMYILN